jgi:hypothetical protein
VTTTKDNGVQRQTEPAKLRRLVRGELDWIVMKALEKDRNRRYETANSFAMDLQRYLADEPVQAGPPSAWYRLRKFVGRNRGFVAASVALALSLLAGLSAVLVVQGRSDRDRAARAAWTDGSVTAAAREARERVDEAWALKDHADRMQRATDAALAALRRADDYVAGGPASEGALTELADARRVVDDLARHARLISAEAANLQKDAEETGAQMRRDYRFRDMCNRIHTALREFGLDPIDGPTDKVAGAVAGSRIRDTLLGMLLRWKYHAFMQSLLRRYLKRSDLLADAPAIRDRLGRVVRTARQLCGGPMRGGRICSTATTSRGWSPSPPRRTHAVFKRPWPERWDRTWFRSKNMRRLGPICARPSSATRTTSGCTSTWQRFAL